MRMTKTLYRAAATVGLVIYFFCLAGPFQACAEPVPFEQQEFLAIDYRFRVSRAVDAAERESLYLRIMDECPDTDIAEESYWALSNLYLDDFDESQEDKAAEVLELFLKRYPASWWAPHVEARLIWLRGNAD